MHYVRKEHEMSADGEGSVRPNVLSTQFHTTHYRDSLISVCVSA
jgi:hypothetical protein